MSGLLVIVEIALILPLNLIENIEDRAIIAFLLLLEAIVHSTDIGDGELVVMAGLAHVHCLIESHLVDLLCQQLQPTVDPIVESSIVESSIIESSI